MLSQSAFEYLKLLKLISRQIKFKVTCVHYQGSITFNECSPCLYQEPGLLAGKHLN